MKRIIFLWLYLLLNGDKLLAQTQLITYGSTWNYLDDGSDQGIAWRALSFDDSYWKTGNAKFGYGANGISTLLGYGPDPNQKYITTYFRKMIFLTDPSAFTYFAAGVLRDDGVVVYVNGVEVYRNDMPSGGINYQTLAYNADDNGTVTQAFTIDRSLFVSGNNMIAVEIHQKTISNADVAFDLELWGNTDPIDQTPPFAVSVNRQLPANEQTDTAAVTFRVGFSEKVRGVDAADFTILTSAGNVRGTLTKVAQEAASAALLDAVKVAAPDSSAYDVTIRAIAGNGVLRLDLKSSNTGITDAAGNALSGGFTNGQTYTVNTSPAQGFSSFQEIDPLPISTLTKEIPQAKVWNYAGKWWAVLATSGGTKVLRLDNTSWTDVLTIASATNSRADCRVVGNLVHILLVRSATSNSYFVSLEYDPAAQTYKRWNQRTSNVSIVFEAGTITATLADDSTGRMWIASNSNGNILARWSDPPYLTWSSPITIASGVTGTDICTVTALPGKIGVFWSDQNTRRFGFRTHDDGADPTIWSADEVPAAQSALNVGNGMADDHLNVVVASDGTLYCAVKTGYDKNGLPTIALLVRRPNNTWDDLYPVASSKEGNRPIVILNEAAGKLKVIYSTHLDNFDGSRSGDILYRESLTSAISFGPPVTLVSGNGTNSLEYTISTHQTYDPAVVILATNESVSPYKAMGVLATDITAPAVLARSSTVDSLPHVATAEPYIGKLNVRPNPFEASTTIDFNLLHSGRYSVILYDSKGRRVRVLRQAWGETGQRNTITIDGSRLASGLYYIKVQTGRNIQTLTLLRR